jgi:hypothetical protein
MQYPTMNEVEAASQQELLKWDRGLPAPSSPDERAIAMRIVERFLDGGGLSGAGTESLRDAGFGDLL